MFMEKYDRLIPGDEISVILKEKKKEMKF